MLSSTHAADFRQLANGLKVADENSGFSLRLDNQGFWCSYRMGEQFYRRCLNGDVVRGRERPTPLSMIESQSLLLDIKQQLNQQLNTHSRLPETVRNIVQKALQYTDSDYEQLKQLYQQCYPEPVTILPPDRYQNLVLQPAQGCPNNQCDFCAFYQDRRFKVLNNEQREEHYKNLKQLFPDSLAGRSGIFVGAANALAIPVKTFEVILQEINQRYTNPKRSICCFGDADHIPKRSTSDWQQLSELGLKQIVLGLETGFPDLRKKLGKSSRLEKTTDLVQQMREAGISTGLTVLVGAGEEQNSLQHLNSTMEYIESLNLGKGDIIYLSPLENSQQVHLEDWLQTELAQFKESLSHLACRVMPYQMGRFNYYS
ncbi:hypothetical protein EOPP23_07470 [Endozoicomonas sp. OPT23]|uniref:radical SAM protein n=1 Tax=Endozoicomonas sp. OPT23 TaxID=2072845 RepID=UPI00129B3799|nr:radical SAM protein [Endozoicomonas sp. OPT23]MRI32822.1 hypothetical protein [Endozoicomonas sp. OPT23]